MASTKELRRRLASVKNTQKITRAMKLVSAAKLKRAQDAVVKSREYTTALQAVFAKFSPEERALIEKAGHPLLRINTESRKVALVVIGGSRGLCGGFNSNTNKAVEAFLREKGGQEVVLLAIGKKPVEYLKRTKRAMLATWEELTEDPTRWPLEEMVAAFRERFISGEFAEVHVLYSKFRSAMSIKPVHEQILPLSIDKLKAGEAGAPKKKELYEPSVLEVFSAVLPRLLKASFLQAALETKAGEHGSRMTAMESATKNAGDLSKKIQLSYNKKRQEGITAQLLDIVGGAEAMK